MIDNNLIYVISFLTNIKVIYLTLIDNSLTIICCFLKYQFISLLFRIKIVQDIDFRLFFIAYLVRV